jgi:hypothetical protein
MGAELTPDFGIGSDQSPGSLTSTSPESRDRRIVWCAAIASEIQNAAWSSGWRAVFYDRF